jgi:hypothetical protein
MKIRISKEDESFSLYIRLRDQRCARCWTEGAGPIKTGGLQISHYFGRAIESTRFDENNCDALCFGCHQYWSSTNRESYREFKIKQLGETGFKMLCIRASMKIKPDPKMQRIINDYLIKSLIENRIDKILINLDDWSENNIADILKFKK